MSEKPESAGPSVGTRWPELIVAAVLMSLAALVIIDSLRVGTGWAEDGPRSVRNVPAPARWPYSAPVWAACSA